MKNNIRIAIISPYSTGPMRGNITTVRRIILHLSMLGVEVIELPADVFTREETLQRLRFFKPDLIHGFHATYCGETACWLAEQLDIPSVITITGSDINDKYLREHPATLAAMNACSAVVCFDESVSCEVTRTFPATNGKLQVIAQGVEAIHLSGTMPCHIADDRFVLLLPAALRPVKQIEFPIRTLASMAERFPELLLVIAGGVIDTAYADMIKEMLDNAPHAIWLGEVPREQMGDLYARCDIVLNCSKFEEMPNSLLEAMAHGRPLLASDIRGNRSLVIPDVNGWLYSSESGFEQILSHLLDNRDLLVTAGNNGKHFAESLHSPATEAQNHLDLYRSIT